MQTLEDQIGYQFKQKDLFLQALTHASFDKKTPSYERLEFLGDRILGFVVADMLFAAFPSEEEGALAKRHSALVNQAVLEKVAETLQLKAHIHYSQRDMGLKVTGSVMADVVEAIIAAIYLDGGFHEARVFITRFWQEWIKQGITPPEDAKTALQEWAQARSLPLPLYAVTGQSGPDHQPEFHVSVTLENFPVMTGKGSSKQTAQKQAAMALLDYLKEKHDKR